MRELTMALAAAATLALAACGGDTATPGAAATTAPGTTGGTTAAAANGLDDACTLLTDAEAAAALGGPAKAEGSTSGKPMNQRLCTWSTSTTPPKTFTVNVTTTAGLDESMRKNGVTAASMFQSSKDAYAAMGAPEALPGVGDEAYVFGSQVLVLKGDFFVSATTAFGDSAEAKAVLKDLTAKAVAKL